MISQKDKELFENLFVLELANNHWGKVERGLKIIRDFGTVVRYNNIKAAIKLLPLPATGSITTSPSSVKISINCSKSLTGF